MRKTLSVKEDTWVKLKQAALDRRVTVTKLVEEWAEGLPGRGAPFVAAPAGASKSESVSRDPFQLPPGVVRGAKRLPPPVSASAAMKRLAEPDEGV